MVALWTGEKGHPSVPSLLAFENLPPVSCAEGVAGDSGGYPPPRRRTMRSARLKS